MSRLFDYRTASDVLVRHAPPWLFRRRHRNVPVCCLSWGGFVSIVRGSVNFLIASVIDATRTQYSSRGNKFILCRRLMHSIYVLLLQVYIYALPGRLLGRP